MFPVLLILGLFGRISALGVQAVNVLAVISYAHVLFQEGFAAAIGQHYLWGYILAGADGLWAGSLVAGSLAAGAPRPLTRKS